MREEQIELKLRKIEEAIGDIVSPPHQRILNNKELAELLKVSTKTLQKWRDNGDITFTKKGKCLFYTWAAVLEMLDKHKIEAYK